MAIQLARQETPLHSINLSLEDVRKIFGRLSDYVGEQADREIGQLVKPEDQDEAEFEENKTKLREEAFRITVTVSGPDGASLYGDDIELFGSQNLPDVISTIFMTNITAYQGVARAKPLSAFELHLDFSKPPLMDSKNLVSDPTPNFSNLVIEGGRDSWVAGISDAVMGVIKHRRNKRSWLHRAFVYDFGLLLLGFPAGLYACWKFSALIEKYLGSIHSFLSATGYVYIVITTLLAYRIFFGYTRWAFPSVELTEHEDAAKRHRAFWYAIATAIVGNVLWEIFS